MKQTSVKKNFIYNILYQILVIIVPFVTSPYLTRVIGAGGLGEYTFTQSYAHYFVLFILLGVNNYGNREMARVQDNKELASKTFSEIYAFQACLVVVVTTIYAISIAFFISDSKTLYWIQMLYVISAGFDINWCCFGLEKFKLTVIRNSIIKIASAALIFLLIHSPEDVWIYTALIAGSSLVSQLMVWPFILKEIRLIKPNKENVIKRIKPNLMLFLPVVAVSLYTIMDKLMLGFLGEKTEVAYYSYAGSFIEIPETIVVALGTVMLPRASKMLYSGKNEESSRMLEKSMQFVMLFSVGAAFGLAAVAQEFIPWYYGSNFARSAIFTAALSPVIVLTSWNSIIRTQFVIPKGHDRIYLATVSSGAVVNLILNMLLIPSFQGIGAVMGTVVAQAAVCVMQYFLTRKEVDFTKFYKDTVAFVVIGALMAVVVYILPQIVVSTIVDVIIKVIIGAAIYGALALLYLNRVKKDFFIWNTLLGMIKRTK